MGKINYGRVLLGGLLAGLVFNVLEFGASFIYGAQFEEALMNLGMTMPEDPLTMTWWVALGFLMGIGLVWLYAAIRPRFGPGAKTALIAGLGGWFFMFLLNALGEGPIGLFPTNLYVLWGVAWLIEIPAATLAGAWLYQEGEAARPATPEPAGDVGAGAGF